MVDSCAMSVASFEEGIDIGQRIWGETQDPVVIARFLVEQAEMRYGIRLTPERLREIAAVYRSVTTELEVVAAEREVGLVPAFTEAS